MNESEIKDLLGRAIGDEPALGISRDEVFTVGRRRVRRRRALAAGGAVAAVVVAAVGAATLTGLVGGPPELPPAADRTVHAPPGPELPLSPSSTASSTAPPVSTHAPAPPTSVDKGAQRLGQQLLHSGLLQESQLRPLPGHAGPPAFTLQGGRYQYFADVVVDGREGAMEIIIDFVDPGGTVQCSDVKPPYENCVVFLGREGVAVVQAGMQSPTGERANLVMGVLPSGLRVAVTASNYSNAHRKSGKEPKGAPVLSQDELTLLVAKSGFSVS